MAKIIIPTPLRKFTNSQSTFESTGGTVKEVVKELVDSNPSLGPQILDNDGNVRSFIRLYVGEEDIHVLEGELTAVSSDTVISIVPAIAGGC